MPTPKPQSKGDPRYSPVGWYLATYVERCVEVGEDTRNLRKRVNAWENTILVKANDPHEAWRRAWKHTHGNRRPYKTASGRMVRWVFEGFTSLIAIYETLEDGNEILWVNYENTTVGAIRKRIRKKNELECFQRKALKP